MISMGGSRCGHSKSVLVINRLTPVPFCLIQKKNIVLST